VARCGTAATSRAPYATGLARRTCDATLWVAAATVDDPADDRCGSHRRVLHPIARGPMPPVPLLLVDERDGRIVEVLETEDTVPPPQLQRRGTRRPAL